VRLDEQSLKGIADRSGGEYFKAETGTDLQGIYETLSSNLVLERERTELTVFFSAFAGLMVLAASVLSMLWFNRMA
jgi:Ca-activated chloride channel family protein